MVKQKLDKLPRKLLEKKKTKYAPLSENQVTCLLELLDKPVH